MVTSFDLLLDQCMDRYIVRQLDVLMNRWMVQGWMNKKMVRWIDEWIDEVYQSQIIMIFSGTFFGEG